MEISTAYQKLLDLGLKEACRVVRLEVFRDDLVGILKERFLDLPADLPARIEAVRDVAALQAAIRRAVHIERPEDLTL